MKQQHTCIKIDSKNAEDEEDEAADEHYGHELANALREQDDQVSKFGILVHGT